MPCRALEAFGQGQGIVEYVLFIFVLMPCRALEAFGLTLWRVGGKIFTLRLNALSGIGGVRTKVWEDAYLLSYAS